MKIINNGSTQLNDNAQQNVAGLAVTNVASSAANVGQNIVGLVNSGQLPGIGGDVTQRNRQTAVNDGVNGQLAGQLDVDVNVFQISNDLLLLQNAGNYE